ncbi:MAG: GNAT family N-acetyltransferase [Aigarchaeota archaeon]|nr:GNAT family N-acetyltransferase [Aigarchaeota archaeon]
MQEIEFRDAKPEDINDIVELVIRLKRLNEEFDPLFKTRDDLAVHTKEYIGSALNSESSIIIVAERGGRLVGVVKADIIDRIFYEPRIEGRIRELYVLPEFRRKDLGKQLVEAVIKKLKNKVDIITAEFPTLNEIAVRFYNKLGFRSILSTYAIEARI